MQNGAGCEVAACEVVSVAEADTDEETALIKTAEQIKEAERRKEAEQKKEATRIEGVDEVLQAMVTENQTIAKKSRSALSHDYVSEVIKLPQSKHVGVNGRPYYYVQPFREKRYRTEEFPHGADCRLYIASEQLEKYGIPAPTESDRTRFNKNKKEKKLKEKEKEAEETLAWQQRNLTSASMQIIKLILAKEHEDIELTPAEMSIRHEFLIRGEQHLLTPEGQHVYAKNQAMISTKERLAEIKDQEKTLDFILQKVQKDGKLTPDENLFHQKFLSRCEQNKLTPGEQYLHWKNQRNMPKKKRHIEKKEDEKNSTGGRVN